MFSQSQQLVQQAEFFESRKDYLNAVKYYFDAYICSRDETARKKLGINCLYIETINPKKIQKLTEKELIKITVDDLIIKGIVLLSGIDPSNIDPQQGFNYIIAATDKGNANHSGY